MVFYIYSYYRSIVDQLQFLHNRMVVGHSFEIVLYFIHKNAITTRIIINNKCFNILYYM